MREYWPSRQLLRVCGHQVNGIGGRIGTDGLLQVTGATSWKKLGRLNDMKQISGVPGKKGPMHFAKAQKEHRLTQEMVSGLAVVGINDAISLQ